MEMFESAPVFHCTPFTGAPHSHQHHHHHHHHHSSKSTRVSVHHATPATVNEEPGEDLSKSVKTANPGVVPDTLVKPHSLLHSNNFARLLTSSSRLNAIPPLPPPKNPAARGSTVPTYYVADDEDDDGNAFCHTIVFNCLTKIVNYIMRIIT